MQQTMTLQDGCQNLADCPNLPYFTYMINIKFPSGCNARWYAWSYRPLKCKVEWYLCWQVHHNGFSSYLILNINGVDRDQLAPLKEPYLDKHCFVKIEELYMLRLKTKHFQ